MTAQTSYSGNNFRCGGPVSRRAFLQAGALGVGGFGLTDFLRLKAEAGQTVGPDHPAVIFVWLPGGPP
ncbi:MAG TPA: DUF1501 domain-containing protein, partial [Planctomycetaceae bacterium]|nr:DUF1501 domain-containing protein [Planctomycetaceae bacterium]